MSSIDDELTGIRGIRKRPAMYVGDTSTRGLHQMAFEVFDESLEELLNGFGTRMVVRLHSDGSLEVSDDGRSVPLHPLPEFDGKSRFEILFTRYEIGKNYRGPRHWRVGAGGLFGVGLVPTNALSEWLTAETGDSSVTTQVRFEQGQRVGKLTQTPSAFHGLQVHFKFDDSIFKDSCFCQRRLVTRLIELTALNPGIKVHFTDEVATESAMIEFNDGVSDLVRLMNRGLTPAYNDVLTVSHSSPDFRLDVALQHVEESRSCTIPFVNTIVTLEGGTHWIGFRAGLTKAVQHALSDESNIAVDGRTLLRGLTAVVSIWVDDPMFEGPTKTKFAQSAVRGTVESLVYRELKRLFESNKEIPRAIWRRSQQSDECNEPFGLETSGWSLADYTNWALR